MSRRRRAPSGVNEDWLAVAVGLVWVTLAALELIVRVPWPLFGWLR